MHIVKEEDSILKYVSLGGLENGTVFTFRNEQNVYMKCRTTSNTVQKIMHNEDDVLVVLLASGAIYPIASERAVRVLEHELKII